MLVDVGVENIILYSTKTKITWRDSEVGGETLGCALLHSVVPKIVVYIGERTT